jgi:predicted Fe-Mo cluster-binding NifX family protein
MRLCVPTLDNTGPDALISAHFGSAPYFEFVDTDAEAFEAVSNAHAHHAHGSCNPLSALTSRRVDAVVCRGLGRRAFERLDAAGIPVYVTDGLDVAAAIAAFDTGRLQRLTIDATCRGERDHSGESGSA